MARRVVGTVVAALLLATLVAWTGCGSSESDTPQASAANASSLETHSPATPPTQKEDSFAPRSERTPAPDASPEPDASGDGEAADLEAAEPVIPSPTQSPREPPAEERPAENPSPADDPSPAAPGPRVFATPSGEPDIDAPISAESDAILERFHDEERIEEFAALLANRNPQVRLVAAKNASYVDDRSKVVDQLIKLLHDPNAEIRQTAAASLSRSSGEFEQVVPALAEALFDPDAAVAQAAAESIGSAKEKGAAAVPQLRAVIARDRADKVSVEAVEALGLIGPAARPAVPRLIELLDMQALLQEGADLDEAWDSGQRTEAAATALGRLGEGAPLVERAAKLAAANDLKESSYFEGLGYVYPTTDAIVERLEHGATSDENKITHYLAIQALGHCRPANARVLAALERVLKSESEEDRAYAARALGEIDPKLDAAFGLLLASAAKETSSDVKEAITGALGNYPIDSPNRLSQILAAAIQGANETEAEDIGQTINFRMDSPTPEMMERYAAFAEDAERSPIERSLALDVLTDFDRGKGRPRAQEIAGRVLDSPASSPDERVAAAMALMPEREEDRRLGPALRKGLASAKLAYHREDAAEWLAADDFAAPESDAALIAALDDPSGAVRKRAAAGVGERGLTAAIDRLIVMSTDDEYEWARNEAATALGEMGASAKAAVPILLEAMRTEENTWFAEHAAVSAVRIALAAELDLAPIAERLTEDVRSQEWHLSDAGALALSQLPSEQIAPAVPALIAVAEQRERNAVSEDVQEALRAAGPLAADAAPVLLSKIEIRAEEKRWDFVPSLIETLGATQGHPDKVLPALAALVDSEASEEGRRRLSAAAAEGIVAYGEAGRPYLSQVVKALELPDAELRSSIIRALGSAGSVVADTVPALKRLAEEDPTDWVRLAAFEALLRIAPDDAEILAGLAGAAANEEENDRSRAFRNSELETRVAVLRAAMKHEDSSVRAGILRLVRGDARTDYLNVLREALDDDDAAVRSQAALALADQGEGDDRTAAILLEWLGSGNIEPENADRVIAILSRSGPSGRTAVLRILSDETRDESLRLALARTMVQDFWTVDGDAAQAVRPSLAAKNPSLRCAAAILLVRSKRYPGGIEPFVAALESADPDRTIAAVAASEMTGPLGSEPSLAETEEELRSAKEALLERLESENEDESVRAAAARSLASYAQDDTDRSRIAKLLADEANRNFGILALPPSADVSPETLAAALALFANEDYFTRSAAQRALARAGDAGMEALAAIAVDDGEEEDRRIAALAILANADTNVPRASLEALRPLAEAPDESPLALLATAAVADDSNAGAAIDRLLAAYPSEDYRASVPVHQFLTAPGPWSEQVSAKTLARWRSDETSRTPELAELLVGTAPDSEEAAKAVVDETRASAEEDEYDSFSYVLTQFGQAAVPALRETLAGKWSTEAKTRAARALRGMVTEGADDDGSTSGPVDLSAAVPELTTLVASEDDELSLTAAEALVAIEPSDAGWNRIGAALTQTDDGVRSRALTAIAAGKSPPVALLDAVVAAMNEEELAWHAPAALAAFGDAAVPQVPRLISALDDEKRRQPTLRALSSLGPAASEALPTLIALLGTGQSEGGFMVPAAIHAVDPEGSVAVEALRAALSDPSRAEAASKTLALFGEKAGAARPELLGLLDSDDLPTRLAAMEALTAIGQPTSETTAKIVHRIEYGQPEERTQAMIAAATWKSPDAIRALIVSLGDDQAYIRTAAMHGLGEFEGQAGEARPKLREILARGERAPAEDRAAALRALARIGLEASDVPLLLTELKSQDEPLVLAAIDGLASLRDAAGEAASSETLASLETLYAESRQRSYVRERVGVAIRANSSDRADALGIPLE